MLKGFFEVSQGNISEGLTITADQRSEQANAVKQAVDVVFEHSILIDHKGNAKPSALAKAQNRLTGINSTTFALNSKKAEVITGSYDMLHNNRGVRIDLEFTKSMMVVCGLSKMSDELAMIFRIVHQEFDEKVKKADKPAFFARIQEVITEKGLIKG